MEFQTEALPSRGVTPSNRTEWYILLGRGDDMPELVIREEQVRVLHNAQLCRWICDYLQEAYPGPADRLGPATLTALVTGAVREARGHALQDGSDIRKYVHVVFLLGPRLADNFPWACKILASRHYHNSRARLRALEDAAIRHLEKKAGAGKEK